MPAQLPPGLPSALLERRPDIREAEQNLVAANAQIGAARALYFPQLSLSAFVGGQSRSPARTWPARPARVYTVAPGALQSIFNAGQIRNQVRLSEAQQRELLIAYQRSIYTALREVSDALVSFDRLREQRARRSNWCTRWKRRCGSRNCAIAAGWTATCRCWTRSEISSPANSRWRNCACRSGSAWCNSIARWAAAGPELFFKLKDG